MPGRSTGSDALSRRLRELRGAAGLRQVDAASRAGISQSLIAKFENGRQIPRPDQAEALCRAYHASARDRRELVQLAEDLREGTRRVVVHRPRHAAIQKQIKRIVESSALVRTFSPSGIPGLLQTPDYIRALFTTGGEVTPADEDGAEQRIANQAALLTDDSDRRFTMVMPEGSLGWSLLPPERMADQIEHISTMGSRRNMSIGIIPWGRVSPVLPLHSWEMYDERAVITGGMTGTTLLTTRADVDAYLELFTALERLAVYGEQAREILAWVADRYRQREQGGQHSR
ncbi:MAG TPA: helix-turn-helix transcriptional regulator [Pseudonocardiaceae bacterium]|nr:helix-turn-helix transcriptional regulator [Pseudonocardiaceae bacterium]